MRYTLIIVGLLFFSFTSFSQWTVHVIDNSGSGADGVKLADINGDKRSDIVTGWEESGITKIYLQPDNESIKERWPSVTIGQTPSVEDAVFVDVNNDGLLDVLSSTENNSQKLFVHFNPGETYLNPQNWNVEVLPASAGIMSWMYTEPMQIDGKNGIDLISGGKGENAGIGWFEAPSNSNDLSAWQWHEISKAGWIMSICTEDMDDDGDKDIVITDRKGKLTACRWLENPGNYHAQKLPWKNHLIGAKGLEVMFMCISDLYNNGTKEILVAERTNNTIHIFSKANNKWKERIIELPKTTGKAKSVEVGDINSDGKMDIVVSTNTLGDEKDGLIWLNGYKLTTTKESDWQSISGIHKAKYDKVELIDIDNDGDLDVLICEENFGAKSEGLGVVWYENPHFE